MTFLSGVVRSEGALLAGDAALATAALFGAGTGVFALAIAPTGGADQEAGWAWQVLSFALMSGAVIAGPVLAWLLHGRRLTWAAVIGGVLGGFLASTVIGVAVMVVAGIGMAVSAITGSELAGPISMLVVAALGFLALALWLVRDGVRDLSHERREHYRLDIARFVAVGFIGVVAAGSLVWAATHSGDESPELMAFALMAGLGGGVIALERVSEPWAGSWARVSG